VKFVAVCETCPSSTDRSVRQPYVLEYLYILGAVLPLEWVHAVATSCKVAGSIPDGVVGIFH
jgi:hypothetical protein